MSFLIASRLSHTQPLFLFKLSSEFILNQVFFFILIFFHFKVDNLISVKRFVKQSWITMRDIWSQIPEVSSCWTKSGWPSGPVAWFCKYVFIGTWSHPSIYVYSLLLPSCYKSSVAVTEAMSSAKPEIVYLVLQRKFTDSNKRKNTTALETYSHQKCLTWI